MAMDPVDKWFSDAEYGSDWQDADFMLCDASLLPKMEAYLSRTDGTMEKKCEIISALLLLITAREKVCTKENLSRIVSLIRSNSNLARETLPCLGLLEKTVLRRILEIPIPNGNPAWITSRTDEIAEMLELK